MRKARSTFLLAGVLLCVAPLSAASAADPAPSYDVRPGAGSSTEPKGGYFVIDTSPGEQVTQTVTIRNDTGAPLALRLAAVDALTAQKGGSTFSLEGDAPVGVARWIALSRDSLTLSPHATLTVPFVVSVPDGARAGVNMAGISVTSPEPPKASTLAAQGQTGASIDVQTRRVIAVQVNLPGPATPQLAIDGVTPVARPDGLNLDIQMENRGHGFTKGTGVITLPDEGFRQDFVFDTFVPGTSISYPITWSTEEKKGSYRVRVEAHYDAGVRGPQTAIFDSTFTVGEAVQKDQVQRQVAVPAGEDDKSSGGLPAGALAAGVLAALLLTGGGILFGRRSKAGPATPPVTGAVVDLRPTVLICDDDPDIRLLYRQVMEATGAIVLEAADGLDCLRLAGSVQPDLVLLDLILPGLGGLDVLTELRRLHPFTPVVIMSGALSGDQRDRSLQLGAAESVEKLGLVARIPALVDRYRQRGD